MDVVVFDKVSHKASLTEMKSGRTSPSSLSSITAGAEGGVAAVADAEVECWTGWT